MQKEQRRSVLIGRRGLLVVWYLAVFGLAAITSSNIVRAAEAPLGVALPAQDASLPAPQFESQQAALQHTRLVASFGGEFADPRITAYIKGIGDRLLASGGLRDQGFDYHFTLIDSPQVFAFSLAGGYIYLSRGMIALANCEAELAAVLAHAIGHVVLRHGAARDRVVRTRYEKQAEIAEALQVLTVQQEFEADDISLQILAAAGYDPKAQARFLTAVGRESQVMAQRGVGPRPSYEGAHPGIPERIERAVMLAKVFDAPRAVAGIDSEGYLLVDAAMPSWFTGREQFLAIVDGLPFGRRPAEGMIDGATYVNTTSGFAFQLPAGFRFTAVGGAVMAEGPNGASIRVDMQTVRGKIDVDMATLLRQNTPEMLELTGLAAIDVNGQSAAHATATVTTEDGPATLEFAMVQLNDYSVARFQAFVPNSLSPHFIDAIRDAPKSLRILSQADRRAKSPLKVQVVTATTDAPAAFYGAQMRTVDHPLDWFLTLNQMAPDAAIRAGDRIKIIAP